MEFYEFTIFSSELSTGNKKYLLIHKVVVIGFKANCPLVGPGPIGGMPSVGVFLRDRSPYLSEFLRKPRKTPNG